MSTKTSRQAASGETPNGQPILEPLAPETMSRCDFTPPEANGKPTLKPGAAKVLAWLRTSWGEHGPDKKRRAGCVKEDRGRWDICYLNGNDPDVITLSAEQLDRWWRRATDHRRKQEHAGTLMSIEEAIAAVWPA